MSQIFIKKISIFFLLRLLGKNSNQTWISFASDVARTNIEAKYYKSVFFAKLSTCVILNALEQCIQSKELKMTGEICDTIFVTESYLFKIIGNMCTYFNGVSLFKVNG